MSEQDLQKKIIKHIESNGGYVVKVISASKSGVPDLLACLNGKFVGIEVKAPGKMKNVSPLQEINLERIRKAGGQGFAADSLEKVIKELE